MKNQKGITLVALIITIIVMLILVSVSVAVVINSGLLEKAQQAGEDTKAAYENESNMPDGVNVNVDGNIVHKNFDDFVSP